MKSPAALVAHLNANLPAAWIVCALPKPLRRRAYGARLVLGDLERRMLTPPVRPQSPDRLT